MARAIGEIVQISVSPKGGVPKRAVPEAQVTPMGLAEDWQKNRKLHGGPERALCLYALEVIEQLQAEGHPIAPGTTGENLTLRGVPWREVQIGDRMRLGDDVWIQISSLTVPCKTIAASFASRKFSRIQNHGDARMYARVLREGRIRAGDRVEVVDA